MKEAVLGLTLGLLVSLAAAQAPVASAPPGGASAGAVQPVPQTASARQTGASEIQIVTLPQGAKLEMVHIPAGSFQMGSNDPGWSFAYEQPVHTVTLESDFYIGKFEVTQKQWLAIMGKWPGPQQPKKTYGLSDNHPAYHISWNDICTSGGFLERLNQHVKSSGQGSGSFRLPTEAEWEYACRAKSTSRYYFGDSNCSQWDCYVCGLDLYAWYCGNSGPVIGTKPVGEKLPNAFNLYDMHGNVWEWCEDYWHENYKGAPRDGRAWLLPVGGTRVVRGSSWNTSPQICRSSNRFQLPPDYRDNSLGFRLVRTP